MLAQRFHKPPFAIALLRGPEYLTPFQASKASRVNLLAPSLHPVWRDRLNANPTQGGASGRRGVWRVVENLPWAPSALESWSSGSRAEGLGVSEAEICNWQQHPHIIPLECGMRHCCPLCSNAPRSWNIKPKTWLYLAHCRSCDNPLSGKADRKPMQAHTSKHDRNLQGCQNTIELCSPGAGAPRARVGDRRGAARGRMPQMGPFEWACEGALGDYRGIVQAS